MSYVCWYRRGQTSPLNMSFPPWTGLFLGLGLSGTPLPFHLRAPKYSSDQAEADWSGVKVYTCRRTIQNAPNNAATHLSPDKSLWLWENPISLNGWPWLLKCRIIFKKIFISELFVHVFIDYLGTKCFCLLSFSLSCHIITINTLYTFSLNLKHWSQKNSPFKSKCLKSSWKRSSIRFMNLLNPFWVSCVAGAYPNHFWERVTVHQSTAQTYNRTHWHLQDKINQ